MISQKMRNKLDENIQMGIVEEIPLWDFPEESKKEDTEKKSNKDKDDKQ